MEMGLRMSTADSQQATGSRIEETLPRGRECSEIRSLDRDA